MKVVRNVILNNIDIHDQSSRMHRFPPGVAKIFQIREIQRLQLFPMTYTVHCFGRNKSCQKLRDEQL